MIEHLTVLVVGSGAREHVLSCAYEKSSQVKKIIVAPGNDFIKYKRDKEVLTDKNCSLDDPQSILDVAKKYKANLVDVASDNALAAGAIDLLEKHNIIAFGPTQKAARIESSKIWSRLFQRNIGVPCPRFAYFDNEEKALEYAQPIYGENPKKRLFVKADGLCGGKGSLGGDSLSQTLRNIKKMRQFGESGSKFLVEDGLIGEEFSYYAMLDGLNYQVFKSVQDNKRLNDFDMGSQTGGMGSNSPACVTEGKEDNINKVFIDKVIGGMFHGGIPYEGILYLGGMVTAKGQLACIEYNARWGDPEVQTILPGVRNDYAELVLSAIEGRLNKVKVEQDNLTRVCVVGAAKGYPDSKQVDLVRGKEIFRIEEALEVDGVSIFGAGIKMKGGKFYADRGRLFSVVGEGKNILEAQDRAYAAISKIKIEDNNLHYRTDIAFRDVQRSLSNKYSTTV